MTLDANSCQESFPNLLFNETKHQLWVSYHHGRHPLLNNFWKLHTTENHLIYSTLVPLSVFYEGCTGSLHLLWTTYPRISSSFPWNQLGSAILDLSTWSLSSLKVSVTLFLQINWLKSLKMNSQEPIVTLT